MMKNRAAKWKPMPNPPGFAPIIGTFPTMKTATLGTATKIPDDILGVPVRFSQHHPGIADARGLLRWKRVVVGPRWLSLDPNTRQGILFHEVAHCLHYDLEKRLLLMALTALPALFLPWKILLIVAAIALMSGISFLCGIEQEMSADDFAAKHGHGEALAGFLKSSHSPASPFYPRYEKRQERLAAAIDKFMQKGD
jgi:Zn-dependent protease with chaperone function